MLNIRKIWIARVNFVNEIARDIVKHKASEEVCKYADRFAEVSCHWGTSGDYCGYLFVRVNCGEAYAYVNLDQKLRPTGKVWFNVEEMGCSYSKYVEVINWLNSITTSKAIDNCPYYDDYVDAINDGEEDKHIAEKLKYVSLSKSKKHEVK